MELIQKFEYKELRVLLFYNGSQYLPCEVYINNEKVYEDNTFRPSPMIGIDTPECVSALLFFITISENANSEFFESRDCEELDIFSETKTCEEIRMMVNDFEQREDADFLAENEMSFKDASILETYISAE